MQKFIQGTFSGTIFVHMDEISEFVTNNTFPPGIPAGTKRFNVDRIKYSFYGSHIGAFYNGILPDGQCGSVVTTYYIYIMTEEPKAFEDCITHRYHMFVVTRAYT